MKSKELCEMPKCNHKGKRYFNAKWVCDRHYYFLKYGEPEIRDYYKGKMKSKRVTRIIFNKPRKPQITPFPTKFKGEDSIR